MALLASRGVRRVIAAREGWAMGEKVKAAIQRWRQRRQHRKQHRRENPAHNIGAAARAVQRDAQLRRQDYRRGEEWGP